MNSFIIKKSLIYSFLYICFSTIHLPNAKAQFFNSDQNPPSLRWRQITTENFRIVYPHKFETEAQRMANTLQTVLPFEQHTLRRPPRPITVILQNQGVIANGFVQLAPRRSEFFTTPPQSFDFQDWLNSLVVHESRHMVQFAKLTDNTRRPFFESLGLAIFGITLPPWFYEGDAVATETALSRAGRGRIPEWNMTMRSNTLSGHFYSYSKNFFSSYTDFTPGYYQLGYFLNAKLRKDHGPMVVDSILSYIRKNPLRPYSLSRAVRNISGLNTRQLHDSTQRQLAHLWKAEEDSVRIIKYSPLNKRTDSVAGSYLLPQVLPNGNIAAIKTGYRIIPRIVEIDSTSGEKKLVDLGSQENPWFSTGGNKIVWDETRYDPRFLKRSYSVINIYDLRTRQRKQLTHRSRLFSPAISADGRKIVAVEITEGNLIRMVILNPVTGTVQNTFNSPGNQMIQTPSFHPDGKRIVFVTLSQAGKGISELDLNTRQFTPLLPSCGQDLQRPIYADGKILFKGNSKGHDNICELQRGSSEIKQISYSRFGAFNPSYDAISGRVIAQDWQRTGFNLIALNYATAPRELVTSISSDPGQLVHTLSEQEKFHQPLDSIPQKVYTSKPYRELSNLFYVHSLVPIGEKNGYFDDYNIGLELQSNNQLNTASSYLGYRYNNYLRKGEYLAGFSYSRFYPVISVDYTNEARLIYRRVKSSQGTTLVPVNWREHDVEASIKVPLYFNKFNHVYGLQFLAGTSYTSRYNVDNPFPALVKTISLPMHYQLSLSHNVLRAGRDLAPKWGQSIRLDFRNLPFQDQLSGQLLTLRSNFYFPGLLPNHSFAASFNYRKGSGIYNNSIIIPQVNGYSQLPAIEKVINTLLFDYRFPFLYPDWQIGPLAYIKRLKAGLFADFQNVGHGNTFSPRSFGIEMRADMNLMRFYLPNFDMGGKIIFLNEKPSKKPIFELIATYSY